MLYKDRQTDKWLFILKTIETKSFLGGNSTKKIFVTERDLYKDRAHRHLLSTELKVAECALPVQH